MVELSDLSRLRAAPPFLNTGFLLDMFDWDPDRLRAFTEDEAVAPIESLGSIIELAIAIDELAHGDDGDGYGRQQIDRTVRLLLLDMLSDRAIRAVIEQGLPTGAARRMALSRARQRRRTDDGIDRVMAWVTATITAGRVAA